MKNFDLHEEKAEFYSQRTKIFTMRETKHHFVSSEMQTAFEKNAYRKSP